MCFGSQDNDPTQQPIKITQASDAQTDSAPSKRKEQKSHPYNDSDSHEASKVHRSEKGHLDAKNSEPATSAPLSRKELRNKYNKKPNAVGTFAGNNYDFV